MSIKWKITVLFLLLAGVPVLVGWVFVGQYKALVRTNTMSRLEAVASNLEARMGLVHQINQERLAGITSRTQLRLSLARYLDSGNEDARRLMQLILDDALGSIPTFKRISITNLEGDPQVETGAPDGVSLKPLIQQLSTQQYLHVEFRQDSTGDWELLMTGPLELNGRVIGIAILHAEIADILEQANRDAYLTNSGDVLLAVRDDQSRPRQIHRSSSEDDLAATTDITAMVPVIDAVQGLERTYADITDHRGIPVLAATRYAEQMGLGMVVKIDQQEVFGPLQALQWRQFWMTLAAVGPIFLLGYWISRSVYRPLKQLVQSTHIIGEGDLSHRVNNTAPDEIGDLARAFDAMIDRLQASNQKLITAKEDMEHFTHIAAHDLREPLRQNRSLLDLLLMATEQGKSEKATELAGHLYRNADRMLQMIDDFRLLTKIENADTAREVVSLDKVIDEVLALHAVSLRSRGITVSRDPHPPETSLYASMATLLYGNLVQNALVHTQGDGFQLHFSSQRLEGVWVFGVRNTQSFIPDEDKGRIFQMFRTGKRKSGSGVGLNICKKVVDRHQGRIWVETEPDVTWFKFTLEGR